MVSCESFRKRLEQTVEERAELAADLEAHVSSCELNGCQELYQEYLLLNAVIPHWRRSLPEVDLESAVLTGLGSSTLVDAAGHASAGRNRSQTVTAQPVRLESQARPALSATAVAVVLATLSLCVLLIVGSFPNAKPSLATNANLLQETLVQNDIPPQSYEEDEDVEAELKELGKAYGTWVQGATRRLSETMTVVLLEEESQATEGASSWFSNLSEQIEPIESKLDETFKILMENVSTESNEQTDLQRCTQNEYFGLA